MFFDVFPTLKAEGTLRELFENVEVPKVTTNKERSYLKIHIFSTHLIQKRQIVKMEEMIREQLFGRTPIWIHIVERYQLSGQYTPKNLMEAYKESILFELRQKSAIEYNMFQNASCIFEEGNKLKLEMEDNIVAQGKEDSIRMLLKEVYEERFQIPIAIEISYCPAKESKHKKLNEMQLLQEVEAIMEKNAVLKKAHQEKKAEEKTAGEKQENKKTEKTFQKSFKKREFTPLKRDDDPNLIYGRNFDEEPIELREVTGEMGEIVIRGQVISFDTREIRNEKTIIMFAVTDFTDSIMVKMFVKNEQLPQILGEVKKGAFLKIKGVTAIDRFDSELTIGSVHGIKKAMDFRVVRKDTYPEKRVELHCHTKMSDMDGVSDAKAIVKRAHDWGHKAIAITDHGVVQAFTDANHYIETLDKDDPFKIIYGVEGYLVDDLTEIAVGAKEESLDDAYVVFDIETTGFSSIKDKIIEIGAVRVENGKIVDKFSTFVNPGVPIPFKITQLTSITDGMVMDAPRIEEVLPKFLEFVDGAVLVAHNAGFDVGFIEQNCRYQDIIPDFVSVDTVALARVLMPTLSKYKLDVVAKALNISLESHHRAVDDAGATAEIFVKFVEMLKERGITTLKGVNQFGNLNPNAIRKLPTYHVIILACNDEGRINLYRLVSMSHLKYFGRRPRIPKSELNKYRRGLIVGSACEAGELYQAVLNNRPPETIAKIVDFYDYLEIQPNGNNAFMIESDRVSAVPVSYTHLTLPTN